jgi:prepilin signal peptidase PulO-like enzyme (type II secretory pathway)
VTSLAACVATATVTMSLAYVANRSSREAGVEIRWLSRSFICSALTVAVLAGILAPRLPVVALMVLAAGAVHTVTDMQTGFMFDSVQVVSAALVLVSSDRPWFDELAGAVVALTIAGVPYVVSRGRGFGLADVKFAAIIGAALGSGAAVETMYVAYVSGGAAAISLLLRKRAARDSPIAFGPFLTFGTAWTLLEHSWF